MLKFTRLFQVLRSHQPTHRRTLLYTEIAIPWPGLLRGGPRFFLPLLFWLFVPVALIIINLLYLVNLSTFFSHSPVSSFRVSYRKASSPTWTTMEVRFVYFDQPVFCPPQKLIVILNVCHRWPPRPPQPRPPGWAPPSSPTSQRPLNTRCHHSNDKNHRTKR